MIEEREKNILIKYAPQYGIKKIYLFGSILENCNEANDIDIAVEGENPIKTLNYEVVISDLIKKNIDLVDLNLKNAKRIGEIIKKEGFLIYG